MRFSRHAVFKLYAVPPSLGNTLFHHSIIMLVAKHPIIPALYIFSPNLCPIILGSSLFIIGFVTFIIMLV